MGIVRYFVKAALPTIIGSVEICFLGWIILKIWRDEYSLIACLLASFLFGSWILLRAINVAWDAVNALNGRPWWIAGGRGNRRFGFF
ncbi:hypothetical protein [Anaerosporomusa subterranea]|uniref:hypothetical protein n=1 Tax=Anaerosporomusa subterranea TaxID=1794912 RepID=UPI0012E9735F|nr:hypothetical protein [Anaerosporomusa subterranea]